jgi:hypothetical protein
MNIAIILLNDLKTVNPGIFKEMIQDPNRETNMLYYGVPPEIWDMDPKTIIKEIMKRYKLGQIATMEVLHRRGVPTNEEILNSILADRARAKKR